MFKMGKGGLCSVVELRTGDGLITMEQSRPESIFSPYYMLDVTLHSLKACSKNHSQKPMKYVILNYFQNEISFKEMCLKSESKLWNLDSIQGSILTQPYSQG